MESSDNVKKMQKVQQSNDSSESKQKIDGEMILHDVMDGVCRCLNANDLSHVAQVCKSWKEEASREMEKRYLELKVLPYLHSEELNDPSFRVSNVLNNKPHVTLLFPGTNSRFDDVRDELELEYDTANTYQKHLPNKLIVVGVFESMMNAELINSVPAVSQSGSVLEQYLPCGTLSLTLPLNKLLNIKESHVFESDFIEDPTAKFNDMIKNILDENTETKSSLLIFVANPDRTFGFRDPVLISMLNTIKSRLAGKSCTMWGLVTSYKMFACNKSSKDANSSDEKEARLVGLNLSGPNFDSWSTVISVNITKAQMEEKLNTFKDKVCLKGCSMGFITCPITINEPVANVCYSDNRELVSYVKTLFPEVPFLGTFCEDEDFYFGIDSMSQDANGILSHEIISIMILSYD